MSPFPLCFSVFLSPICITSRFELRKVAIDRIHIVKAKVFKQNIHISISSYKKTGGPKSPCIVNAPHLGYGRRNTRCEPCGSLVLYTILSKNQLLILIISLSPLCPDRRWCFACLPFHKSAEISAATVPQKLCDLFNAFIRV